MRKLSFTVVLFLSALLTASPFALAEIRIETSGSGSVTNTTSAEAHSGGQGASGGSASAEVYSEVHLGGSGGTVEVETVTKVNGEVKKESIKKEIPPGGVGIDVSVTTASATTATTTVSALQVFVEDFWSGVLITLQNIFWFF